ncbi:AI-2E family transporter [bacterium]|nr:AI-2E family transporter [bacterium]
MTESTLTNRRRFVVIAMFALLAAFLYVIHSLLLGVVGAVLLWSMTSGIYEKFLKWTRNRKSLSSALSVVTVFVLVVGPVASVLTIMAGDVVELAGQGQEFFHRLEPRLESLLSRVTGSDGIELFGYRIDAETVTDKLESLAEGATTFLLDVAKKTASGIANAVMLIFVMLYTLFFCYIDGAEFLSWLKGLLPLSREQSETLFRDFFTTSLTTLKTLGIIGVVQGGLGGLAFWICGIPSPFFWTVLLVLATIIPVVGAQIILMPAAVLLILFGQTWQGIALFLWSWIVIANVDNLLRPYLVRRATNLHELLVFLSTIGGIAVFGFWGFLIGPVIASLLKVLIEFYSAELGSDKR